MHIPTYDEVEAAHGRINPYIHRTPVLSSAHFNERTGAELFFKCENFQKAGAFKVRGASNAVFGLDEERAAKGVATHSSGNHGLSLSYALQDEMKAEVHNRRVADLFPDAVGRIRQGLVPIEVVVAEGYQRGQSRVGRSQGPQSVIVVAVQMHVGVD